MINKNKKELIERIKNEKIHANIILKTNELNWGWNTVAGKIRKQRRVDFLCETNDVPANPKVLEVGCGTGTYSESLSKKFKDLTCIDISDEFLANARRRVSGLHFLNEDIHKTSFPSNYFDLVLGVGVLHHLDWELALKEIFRILKPGGQIRFSEPNLLNPQIFLVKNSAWLKKKIGDSPDEYAFTAREIRCVLKNCGFIPVMITPYEFLHPNTPKLFIELVVKIESWLEKTIFREIAGSLKIVAKKP